MSEQHKHIAVKSLESYDVNPTSIDFFVEETNVFYKVQCKDETFMLKIFEEASSDINDNLAEVYFINQVASKTDIEVPTVLPNKYGKEITLVLDEQSEKTRRTALYTFLEGEPLYQNETPYWFEKLGETTAKLHNLSESLELPSSLHPKRWDKVFYYHDEVAVYNDPKYDTYFTTEDRVLLDWFIQYLDERLKELYIGSTTFIIHGDLNPWNVFIHEDAIRLIDFEEAMDATALHDLAILLFYYRYDTNFNYNDVKTSLFKGYERVRKLPDFTDFEIDLLIMARTANFINYVLLIWEDPKDYISSRLDRIRDFITTYNITKE
jgi:Ser/Thr protein kinase RdoA (MazF antagonist)